MLHMQCKLGLNRTVTKGSLLLKPKQILPYLPSHCSGVNKIREMAIRAHALQSMQVTFTSISNEGHFTPVA
jgi:hypothetical protein